MRLELDMTQKQVLAPQMRQSIKILDMTSEELSGFIKRTALENPLLVVNDSPEHCRLTRAYSASIAGRIETDFSRLATRASDRGESFPEHLKDQIPPKCRFERQLIWLIENLDDRGYIPTDIAKRAYTKALDALRDMEPAGVGAVDLADCLRIQLERETDADEIAIRIVSEYINDLAQGRLSFISKKLGISREALDDAIAHIKRLNPIPSIGFATHTNVNYIFPDVYIKRAGDDYRIECDRTLPQIRISSAYDKTYLKSDDPALRDYIARKRRQAEELMDFIDRRSHTLEKLTRYILSVQEDFFKGGNAPLEALSTADLSQAVGLHISTVCRALRDKYLSCERGVYPFRYFLSRALPKTNDQSTDRVKVIIKSLIESENTDSPLSDQALCDILNRRGILISRRCVAKYRTEMSIPGTYARRGEQKRGQCL